MSTLWEWFMLFGAPKELASDGATTFMSEITQQFLKTWGIRHRVSSVAFPHSNCRAEVAVKTAKRLIRDNVGPSGSLDTDKFARALMQYRNTPLQDINLSPAQILLGRNIRDFFPFVNSKCKIRKEWMITAEEREKALSRRHATQLERLSLHTHTLTPLDIGDSVRIQNQTGNHPSRWDRTGVVIETGPGPRQYYVRTDGSARVSLRNRKFLHKCITVADPPFHVPVTEPLIHPSRDSQDVEQLDPTPQGTPSATPKDSAVIPSALHTRPGDDMHRKSTPTITPETTPKTPTIQSTQREPQTVTIESSQTRQAVRRTSRISRPPERFGDYVTH